MRSTHVGVLALALALFVISACGGATNPTSRPEAAPPSSAPSSETAEFVIGTDTDAELRFDPAQLTVHPGADVVVTFENRASVPHNLTFPAPIDVATSTMVEPQMSQTVRFKAPEAGDYTFVCTLHPGMDGKLSVSG